MIAVTGCNMRHFELFMGGKYDIKPEYDKQYFHVNRYKNLTGLSFESILDLKIIPTSWEVENELETRIKSK